MFNDLFQTRYEARVTKNFQDAWDGEAHVIVVMFEERKQKAR
jgi:hypothetical protein